MTPCDLDTSVPDWIIEHPETLAIFDELGIEYGCGGKSLAYACYERGLDVAAVLAKLLRCVDAGSRGRSPVDR
jgi:iron-sulfur cluster repair protein YtfE (RIC family)